MAFNAPTYLFSSSPHENKDKKRKSCLIVFFFHISFFNKLKTFFFKSINNEISDKGQNGYIAEGGVERAAKRGHEKIGAHHRKTLGKLWSQPQKVANEREKRANQSSDDVGGFCIKNL